MNKITAMSTVIERHVVTLQELLHPLSEREGEGFGLVAVGAVASPPATAASIGCVAPSPAFRFFAN